MSDKTESVKKGAPAYCVQLFNHLTVTATSKTSKLFIGLLIGINDQKSNFYLTTLLSGLF